MYICDYRLDKSAHLFYKIHRNRYPVCTKSYAFDHFPKRLTPKRDFSVSRPLPPFRASLAAASSLPLLAAQNGGARLAWCSLPVKETGDSSVFKSSATKQVSSPQGL